MNCKPDQLAWIKVPRYQGQKGVEQLHNRVVKTVRLLDGWPEPMWEVTPAQRVTFTTTVFDRAGQRILSGETAVADGIPDAWLRPFDPASEPEAETATRELELTA